MKKVTTMVGLMSILSTVFFSQISNAYCVASTKCKNGEEIYCSLPAYNYYNQVIINPVCESKTSQWVSCRRTNVNGLGGAAQFISCEDSKDKDVTVDSYGNRF